jgi:hypothetical protein
MDESSEVIYKELKLGCKLTRAVCGRIGTDKRLKVAIRQEFNPDTRAMPPLNSDYRGSKARENVLAVNREPKRLNIPSNHTLYILNANGNGEFGAKFQQSTGRRILIGLVQFISDE